MSAAVPNALPLSAERLPEFRAAIRPSSIRSRSRGRCRALHSPPRVRERERRAWESSRYAGVMSGTSLDGIDAVVADFASGCKLLAATHIEFPSELRRDAPRAAGIGRRRDRARRARGQRVGGSVRPCDSLRLPGGRRGDARRRRRRRSRPDGAPSSARRVDVAAQQSRRALPRRRTSRSWPTFACVTSRPAATARRWCPHFTPRCSATRTGIVSSPTWAASPTSPTSSREARCAGSTPVRATCCSTCGTRAIARAPSTPAAPSPRAGTVDHLAAAGDAGRALLRRAAAQEHGPRSLQRRVARSASRPVPGTRAGRAGDAGRADRAIAGACRSASIARGAAELYLCGGGARNPDLDAQDRRRAAGVRVATDGRARRRVVHVEALAFAWLARETVAGRPGNVPEVTGAARPARARRHLSERSVGAAERRPSASRRSALQKVQADVRAPAIVVRRKIAKSLFHKLSSRWHG